MMNINRGSFVLRWVAAVTASMVLATMAAFVSMWSISELVGQAWGDLAMALSAGAIFGALLGLGVGLGQAIVLSPQGIPFGRWIGQTVLAGAVGMTIGFTAMFRLFDMDNIPQLAVGLAMALSLGLPIGLVQWQLLKPHVAQAQLWVPICILAFLISFAVGLPLGGEGREWLSIGVMALLTALLTGAGLLWLARDGETALVA